MTLCGNNLYTQKCKEFFTFEKVLVVKLKNNIRNVRRNMKLSQEELANKCGVTRQTINAIENNKYDPTLSLAFKLSIHLNRQIEKLFFYEGENK